MMKRHSKDLHLVDLVLCLIPLTNEIEIGTGT